MESNNSSYLRKKVSQKIEHNKKNLRKLKEPKIKKYEKKSRRFWKHGKQVL
jgi:hypothetical protein